MSGKSRRCQGTESDSSGSSINTKNLDVPERYKWLNSEAICFSPEDRSASSIFSAPLVLSRAAISKLKVELLYMNCLSVMYSLHKSQNSEIDRSLSCNDSWK